MGVDVNEPKAPKADSAKSDDADNDSRKKARQQLILLQNYR